MGLFRKKSYGCVVENDKFAIVAVRYDQSLGKIHVDRFLQGDINNKRAVSEIARLVKRDQLWVDLHFKVYTDCGDVKIFRINTGADVVRKSVKIKAKIKNQLKRASSFNVQYARASQIMRRAVVPHVVGATVRQQTVDSTTQAWKAHGFLNILIGSPVIGLANLYMAACNVKMNGASGMQDALSVSPVKHCFLCIQGAAFNYFCCLQDGVFSSSKISMRDTGEDDTVDSLCIKFDNWMAEHIKQQGDGTSEKDASSAFILCGINQAKESLGSLWGGMQYIECDNFITFADQEMADRVRDDYPASLTAISLALNGL